MASLTPKSEVSRWKLQVLYPKDNNLYWQPRFIILETSVVYLRSMVPVVEETDERLLKALVASAESSMRSLALFFPEMKPLLEDWKKRGGGQ